MCTGVPVGKAFAERQPLPPCSRDRTWERSSAIGARRIPVSWLKLAISLALLLIGANILREAPKAPQHQKRA